MADEFEGWEGATLRRLVFTGAQLEVNDHT